MEDKIICPFSSVNNSCPSIFTLRFFIGLFRILLNSNITLSCNGIIFSFVVLNNNKTIDPKSRYGNENLV